MTRLQQPGGAIMREPIEVVIPTLCDARRGPLLLRAIESVVSQEGVAATPLVVVNGARFDPELLAQLEARDDVRLIRIAEPDLFRARRAGFESLRTTFFATLDDDDVFLPGALAKRLAVLRADPDLDWVVTNGVFVAPDGERPFVADIAATRRDPYGSLLDYCWLCTGGNLFRTSALAADMFDAVRSMDITYIALRLLVEGKKVAFLDEPTFRYFSYADSTSKQDFYNLPAAEAIRAMMRLPVPRSVRRGLAGKYRRAMHDVASHHLREGRLREAWMAHLRSMSGPRELLRYAAFSRKLLAVPRRAPAALAPMR